MTIRNLMKSIGWRVLDCYIHVVLFAAVLLLLCLIGQGTYLIMARMATFTPDPWVGYAAKAFRIIIFVSSAVIFVVTSTIVKYKLFRGAHDDVNRYFDTRRILTK